MKATETRRGHGSASRWRRIVAASALGVLLVVLAGPARSASSSSVGGVTVDNSSPSAAAGARTMYVVTFSTSKRGGLSNAAGSEITLVFPPGTDLGAVFTSSVDDITAGANGVGACNPPSGETITCFLDSGQSIAAGHLVRVTINGVTNPPTPSGSLTMSVSTTSDTTPVNSAPFSVVSAHQISQPKVDNSSPSATAGEQTTYVVSFGASKTGGLSNTAGSEITLAFPPGTDLGSVSASSVDDTTTGANGIGSCDPPFGETISCFLDLGQSVAAGHSLRVTLNGVTNPSTSGLLTVSVSTTSDTTPVNSAPYTVEPPPPVPGKGVDIAPVAGRVLVKQPGQKVFTRLRAGEQIPVGSELNATRGVVSLVVATSHGHTATGQARGGVFSVTQRLVHGTELTVLALAGSKPTGCRVRAALPARSRPSRHRPLTVRDPGDFVTLGTYASARGQAARATTWLTKNTCAGTLIRVMRGTVRVHDLPHHRRFLLRTGKSFLAHPGKHG